MPAHPSDSEVQRRAEPVILKSVATQLGVELKPRRFSLPGGASMQIDGVATDESALVEVFAHQGPLKGAQFHKVASDALRLITLAQKQPSPRPRLVIAVGDEAARTSVLGRRWLADALDTWNVEVRAANLDDTIRDELRAAQIRQVMANRPTDALLATD